MFKKYFQHYSAVVFPRTILYNKECACVITFKMRNFVLCRCGPIDMAIIENKDFIVKKENIQKFQTVDLSQSRSFLQFYGDLQNRKKEYQGKKLVGYSSEQMFNVVADVEKYETFLPFCKKSLIKLKSPSKIKADLVIGFPPLVESYTSDVSLVKPQLIKAVCTEGKLFNYLLTTWKFSPGLKNNEKTCIIDFFVSFEFRSALHSHFANLFFNELVRQMESAFYQEAQARYGRPTVKMQTLSANMGNS